MARQSSESFDEHERPTAQRSRPESETGEVDPNATTRIKPFDLEQLVQKGSGTRPVITSEQIDRYMKERTVEIEGEPERPTARPPEAEVDIRDRETIDALTLQRETLIIKPQPDTPTTSPQIPIDVDLSRLLLPRGEPRRRGGLDRRWLTVAAAFLLAMVSALLGFLAGRF